jgi:hypothetical protein
MSSTQYQDIWPAIQADILGLLQADEFIGARPGVQVEPGDIQSVVDTKLAKSVGAGSDGKNGVGFLVLPIERAEDEDVSNPFSALKLTITVDFVENVTLNRAATGTQLPIRVYAARAAKILKLYTPVGFTHSLVPKNPVISEFTDDKNKSLRVGRVEFEAREADEVPLQRLNRPQLVVAGSAYPYTVTVVQAAADRIFYTLDGSHPHAGNPQAKIYDGPATVSEACLFRARAFGPVGDLNIIASDTAAQNFV